MSQKAVKSFVILLSFSKQEQLGSALTNLTHWYQTQDRQEWLTYGFKRTGKNSGEYFFNSTLEDPQSVLETINQIFLKSGFSTIGPYPLCQNCPD